MKLATTTSDFYGYVKDEIEAMELIAEAGFRYLDYGFGGDFREKRGFFGTDENYCERLKNRAKELGVCFVQAHAPMGAPIADDNSECVAGTIRCVEACHALGIPNLVVHSGYLPNLTKEETFARNKKFFNQILCVAERYQINILVENFDIMCIENMYWIDNAPDLAEFIAYVDHPLFHAVWDAGHANMQPLPQHEGLKLLKDHVYALHVQDNMGSKDEHIAPLFGTLNLDSLMQGLFDIGYSGYFTFETGMFLSDSRRKPFEGAERLRKPSLTLKKKAEGLLYELGKYILTSYDCFEE